MGEQDHRFIKWRIQNGLGFKNLNQQDEHWVELKLCTG